MKTDDEDIANEILNLLHVENILVETEDTTQGEEFYNTSKNISGEMSMQLKPWNSNNNKLMKKIGESDKANTKNVLQYLEQSGILTKRH